MGKANLVRQHQKQANGPLFERDCARLASIARGLTGSASNQIASMLLSAAKSTGLLCLLDQEPQAIGVLARRSGLADGATSLIVTGLAAMGITTITKGRVSLFPAWSKVLRLAGAGTEIDAHAREAAAWLRMAEFLRGDAVVPTDYARELLDGRIGGRPGIRAMNRVLAAIAIERLGDVVSGAERILDVGGGDGDLASLLLARNEHAFVGILDLDSGFGPARHIRPESVGNRLRLIEGDARTHVAGHNYDLVIVNELLELFPHTEKQEILNRAVAALAPRGKLCVVKFALDAAGVAPASAALFSLRMHLKFEGACLETDQDVVRMLENCGMRVDTALCISGLKSVIVATRPADPPALCQPLENAMPNDDEEAADVSLWRDLISVATSFRISAVLFAAVELDIVSHMPPDGCTADDVAAKAGIGALSAELLLNALTAIGILHKQAGCFYAHESIRGLLSDGPGGINGVIRQQAAESMIWLRLAEIMRTPGARPEAARIMESAMLPDYLASVALANETSAVDLARHLAPVLADARTVLDLGGGSATYTRQMLLTAPHLIITLFDRKEVIDHNRKALAPLVETGRVRLLAGDALDFEMGERFDLILISDLLHYFSRDEKRRIILNAAQCLSPGGQLVISKFRLAASDPSSLSALLISLKVHLQRPDAYLEMDSETAELVEEAGLAAIRIDPIGDMKTIVSGIRMQGMS